MSKSKGKGSYYEPWPVDFALLELLPDNGLVAGVHWRGRQVKDLVVDLNEQIPPEMAEEFPPYDHAALQSRLRSMTAAGYVVSHPGRGSVRIWARTPEGAAFLTQKNEVLGIEPELPGIDPDDLSDERYDPDQELGDDT